ncbi:G-type lectin S-receptor-like serine/threonine-protein kinase SD2-5 [Camellia lanceoleosa]|uniref:G-type lectin S-receptor-like serine/threonine-protein kinase SD2-5 n=1 Tax=Camellia lanceoleosa TaxID=1840588 RepID=A0ACC0H8A2_9ERIC|nr:G-type lectin S-receptor-like serine/threonine-protein kinase SD2-5 [Camellia lanceoleosa]
MHLLDLFKRKAEEERLLDIVDKYNDDMQTHRAEVVEMMMVAVWCLQSDFSRRPSMSVVVKVLEGSVDVQSNLDYNFTTLVAPRPITVAGHQGDAIGASTPLFASALSGPSATVASDLSQALNKSLFKSNVNVGVKEEEPKGSTSVADLPPIVLVHGIFGFGKRLQQTTIAPPQSKSTCCFHNHPLFYLLFFSSSSSDRDPYCHPATTSPSITTPIASHSLSHQLFLQPPLLFFFFFPQNPRFESGNQAAMVVCYDNGDGDDGVDHNSL